MVAPWIENDQCAVIILHASLTKETAVEVLNITGARQIWLALENAYSNSSVECVHSLRDTLHQLTKGTSSVVDYSRRFKSICDQLVAIGEPVAESDKLHWFLCGLGPSFETFYISIRAIKPVPTFCDLVTQAESNELFLQSLHGSSTPQAAFHAQHTCHSRGGRSSGAYRGRSSHGGFNGGRGRTYEKRPHCKLCKTYGHSASSCPDLHKYASQNSPSDESLAKAFHAQCHVTTNTLDWNVDSGATAHMAPDFESLSQSSFYQGNTRVIFGNGKTLLVTHTGTSIINDHISLRDVLVVPNLTKKLLYVSKLTSDYPVDVLLSQPFYHIQDRKTNKVLAKGSCENGLYVLNPQYEGYRCLDPSTSRIYVTRQARFNETVFPFQGSTNVVSLSGLYITTFLDEVNGPAPIETNPSTQHPNPPSPLSQSPNPSTSKPAQPAFSPSPNQPFPSSIRSSSGDSDPCSLCQPSDKTSSQENSFITPNSPSTQNTCPSSVPHPSLAPLATNSDPVPDAQFTQETSPVHTSHTRDTTEHMPSTSAHPMTTRSKAGIFKPKHIADLASLTTHPLQIVLSALTEPRGFKSAAKDPKWLAAMHEEINALHFNRTWTFVPRPLSTNIVGSKWVYRIKDHSDGSIERYKAHLVAQGYTQIPGLDYSHTFSPVVKASTVPIVLSLAVLNSWKLHQLDVKNAFLNGNLSETAFMKQPPGFVNLEFPNHVCKLSKDLYGLNRADTSLFVFCRAACTMYLLVYVDDLILTGNNESTISAFISRLNAEFAIKELGDLNYFLGLEVAYTDLFLTQSKYATDILKCAGLYDSKPIGTPLAPHETFTTNREPHSDPTLYRSLVGALQYLTTTRPDLSYAVNQVCQFLYAPTIDHFQSVKRILRYVKGTLSFGLIFSRPSKSTLVGYCDADWAQCIETRRSTYGYSIFFGGQSHVMECKETTYGLTIQL
ncbi:uncharacterized protein LOC143570413 [Bidens hawaiensis]|uniref:uncharacterized protein LOC143570413 n=1 Tax=Bidens hawaiensis TaxID=980011 RepID=UPI00404B23FD